MLGFDKAFDENVRNPPAGKAKRIRVRAVMSAKGDDASAQRQQPRHCHCLKVALATYLCH
jgi:hypothetical protein